LRFFIFGKLDHVVLSIFKWKNAKVSATVGDRVRDRVSVKDRVRLKDK